MSNAVEFDKVSKRFMLDNDPLLLSRLIPRKRDKLRELWALHDVSFAVERGDTVAIIGANGSGKTTTLRLIAGVSGPTSGRMRVDGTVAPLIGVGVGFNPELTGRENIHVNGQLLGMSPAEVRANFDSIIAFSELERFLDTPVKFYSSGMFLRLGFSVAVHTRPELLVVDEILAVGDAAFQAKCNRRIAGLQQAGTTVLLVTHNLNLAVQMAPRTLVLNAGRLVFDGPSLEGVGIYHEILSEVRDVSDSAAIDEPDEGAASLGSAIIAMDLKDQTGTSARSLRSGEPFTISVDVEFTHEVENPCLGLMIVPTEGHDVVTSVFAAPGDYKGLHGPGRPLHATIEMTNLLLTGSYSLYSEVFDSERKWLLGASQRESFYVKAKSRYFGTTDLNGVMTINGTRLDPTAPRGLQSGRATG